MTIEKPFICQVGTFPWAVQMLKPGYKVWSSSCDCRYDSVAHLAEGLEHPEVYTNDWMIHEEVEEG